MDLHPYELDYHCARGDLQNQSNQPSQESVGQHSEPNTETTPETAASAKRKYSSTSSGDFSRRTSNVWKHYNLSKENGEEFAFCKYCDKKYSAKSVLGTSNHKRHTEGCSGYKEFIKLHPQANDFDQKRYCELFAEAILCHNYPLSIVEHERLRALHRYLNPNVQDISRYTITKQCMMQYNKYKKMLFDSLQLVSSRICFTSDCWSACTSRGYISLTAHYVDNNWKLQSKILSFRRFPPPHDGEAIFKIVKSILSEWHLEKKVFTLTLDNASANNVMVEKLKDDLQDISPPLPCNGKYFHIRCAAHVLNLIVQKGLQVIDPSIKKLRSIVKYIDSSDARISAFELALKDCNSDFHGQLLIDVATRWNSTYLMIRKAYNAKSAISLFARREKLDYLSEAEWETAMQICDFLEPFYNITMLFSGSTYPTSNLFLANVIAIQKLLILGKDDPCPGIQAMSIPMLDQFEKYWSEHCMILSFAVLLDPRFKMQLLREMFSMLYDEEEVERRINNIYNEFVALYNCYSKSSPTSSSSSSSQSSTNLNSSGSSSISSRTFRVANIFQNFEANSANYTSGKTCVDSYLIAPLLSCAPSFDDKFEILEYWKAHTSLYPVLSRMAKDILAIPITSVASESSFSLGGRIVSKLRASLLPKNVEIFVTTSNWLYGFQPEEEDEEYLKVVKELAISDPEEEAE